MSYIINDNGVQRNMTSTEIEIYEQAAELIRNDSNAEFAAAAEAAAAKTSALSKLKALGLTDAEIAALAG